MDMERGSRNSAEAKHRWRFFRSGGFDQVRLETGADLMALDQLDQKLWMALSCPTRGLEFDERTLELLDDDGDGRIRVPDIIRAVKWAGSLLRNPDDLTRGAAELPLAAIDDANQAMADEGPTDIADAIRTMDEVDMTVDRPLSGSSYREASDTLNAYVLKTCGISFEIEQ